MKMPLYSQKNASEINTPSTQSSQSSILFDYEIQQTIGSGNFGKVKLGIYKPTNKKVAIKILSKEKIKKKNEMRIVKRELDILPSFNHVNVIHFSKCVDDSDYIYIIMDYCELGELFDYIVAKTKLSEDETAFFFYQIINGVDYIHAKGVSHRDLKPENLLLTKNKLLKIVDFGLASTSINQNALGTRCGSPSYASPELLRGKKYNGYKTDIWSIGVIVYAMIYGYLPFDGRNNDELFRLIIKGNVEYPSTISDIVKRILKRMLVVNPEHRITIQEIMGESLYLKGKRIFEEQFGFDPRTEFNNSNKAISYLSHNTIEPSNLYGLNNMHQEINSFRKKVALVGKNNNNDQIITKGKETNDQVIQSIKLNNTQKKKSPIMMIHLQTEPDEEKNTPKIVKMTPFNYYCANVNTSNNSKKKKGKISIKTDYFLLHQNITSNSNTKNHYIKRDINERVRNTLIIHSKDKESNDFHFSLNHDKNYNTNPIKAVNRLFIGKSNDFKDKHSLMNRFPFENYATDVTVKSQKKRGRNVSNRFDSNSYEEQKKRIAMYNKQVLPQLISHY